MMEVSTPEPAPCASGGHRICDHAGVDLEDLRLASHWYDGRMEPGYVRREPEAAKEYLRSVGPAGPFWGL